jgi:hypothetical protein
VVYNEDISRRNLFLRIIYRIQVVNNVSYFPATLCFKPLLKYRVDSRYETVWTCFRKVFSSKPWWGNDCIVLFRTFLIQPSTYREYTSSCSRSHSSSTPRNLTYAYHLSVWIIASSGMLRSVGLVRTGVSEELSAKFLRNVGSYKTRKAYHPRRCHSS